MSISIVDIQVRGNSFAYLTDSDVFPEFVYPMYKFNSGDAVLAEINKKMVEVQVRTTKRAANTVKIFDDLNIEVAGK